MLDIKFIRENQKKVKENIKKKFQNEKLKLVDEVLKKDEEWRSLKQKSDELRSRRNKLSEEINKAKKQGKNIKKLLQEVKNIPTKIDQTDKKSGKLYTEIKDILSVIPNLIHKDVPIGKDESDNKVLRKVGKIKKIDKPKTHVELLETLGLADFEASAKVAGTGFYYMKNELALLNQALIRFAIDFMVKKGYSYIETPLMLNEKAIFASMSRQEIENSVYSIKDEDLHLIGTAEQSLLAMHSSQTLSEDDLPKKYFSYSMCFRKEIGSHGINEKGLWRTHQFNKVEQFIFCKPEDSEKLYDELMKNSEEILKKLELPYRVLQMCSGDVADWKYQTADLEVYRPTTKDYGEVVSLTNCTDYQARKLNIKCSNKGNKRILHTLNDTALATSRILVAILEDNQNKDGSITIPKVLVPYTGFKVIKK